MESIDKLREWARGVTNSNPDENIVSPEFVAQECGRKALLIADEIEREIAERYMKLPLDADGVPIRVVDELECHTNGYDGTFTVFAIGDNVVVGNHDIEWISRNPSKWFHVASFCTHVKPRTLEDVLRECVMQSMTVDRVVDGIPVLGIDETMFGDWIAENEDELRELLRGDAE